MTSIHSEEMLFHTCRPPVESCSRIVIAPKSVWAPIPGAFNQQIQDDEDQETYLSLARMHQAPEEDSEAAGARQLDIGRIR